MPHSVSWFLAQSMRKMAGATGLEPAASAVTGQRSNQLSYAPNQRKGTLPQSNLRINEKIGLG